MKHLHNVIHLRLVNRREHQTNASLFEDDIGKILADASVIEGIYGKNAYSAFLRKHGRRPEREQAATLGRLLGWQVRAADGSMQPPLSKRERAAIQGIKSRRKDFARKYENAHRLKLALNALAEIDASPKEISEYFSGKPDCPAKSQLRDAISWIERFAEESGKHDEDARAAGSNGT